MMFGNVLSDGRDVGYTGRLFRDKEDRSLKVLILNIFEGNISDYSCTTDLLTHLAMVSLRAMDVRAIAGTVPGWLKIGKTLCKTNC